MKAAVVREFGQSPIFADFEDPIASEGEVLIDVTASALSHLVKGRASGAHYSASAELPFVVGVDGVGKLEDGRRVAFMLPRAPFGAMGERTIVPTSQVVPLSDILDDVTAAALINPGMSSWVAFKERAHLVAGETVLINGATGISGRLAVQIAKFLGAGKVIATGRNAETLRSLGADETISIAAGGDAMEESFRQAFAKRVDVVIDYLWGESAERLLIAAAKAAPESIPIRFVQVGSVSNANIALPSAALRSSSLELMGSGLKSVSLNRIVARIGEMLDAAVPGKFTIPTHPIPLSDVETAWNTDDSHARTIFTL